MQVTNRTPKIVVALCIVLAAAALIGATIWTPAKNTPAASPVATTQSLAPMTATFTGEYESGVPVYRLPSIAITTSRSVELAKMAQEEQLPRK